MTTRPLGLVREALAAVGLDMSYAYEDLIFPEHNGFLLQFTETPGEVHIHINIDADEEKLNIPLTLLQAKGKELALVFRHGCKYKLHGLENTESIQIEFLNGAKKEPAKSS